MKKTIRIAIDGPGGAGKSTIAKLIAKELEIDYVDTGAMYRAVAYKMQETGVDIKSESDIYKMLSETEIDFADDNIMLDGKIINDLIRTSEISKLASDCSALAPVREKLVELQRAMGRKKSIIMDGRDITTNVLPDAEFKFYMTASIKERAKRRYEEFLSKGIETSYEKVFSDIETRDHNDMTRTLNPLKKAEDAIELDTTEMTIEDVCRFIIAAIQGGTDGDS